LRIEDRGSKTAGEETKYQSSLSSISDLPLLSKFVILKTAVSHRGTETTEATAKERHLQKVLKNCYPRGEDNASEKAPASPLALCSP